MSNRQEKCPGCGLANFRDAAECRWCALALSDRARNEYNDDAPRGPGRPWGLLLMLFALLVGGGLVWHVQRKSAERAEAAADSRHFPLANQATLAQYVRANFNDPLH